MKIIIDTREQNPLKIQGYQIVIEALPVGDYGIVGFSDWQNPAFIVERKSLDDLTASLTKGRDRFIREVEKMRQFRFKALLIEADRLDVVAKAYRSAVSPVSILASLDALSVRCGLQVFWCDSPDGCARQFESLVRQFCRGIEKEYRRLEYAESAGGLM